MKVRVSSAVEGEFDAWGEGVASVLVRECPRSCQCKRQCGC